MFATRETSAPVRLFALIPLVCCASLVCLPTRGAEAQLQLPQFISADVQSVALDGDFVLDGGAFPPNFADTGILSLSGPGEDEVVLGLGSDQSYGPLLVIEGSYTPSYRILFSAGGVPINPLTAVGPPVIQRTSASGTALPDISSSTRPTWADADRAWSATSTARHSARRPFFIVADRSSKLTAHRSWRNLTVG